MPCSIEVDIDDLIVGRELSLPLLDARGVLLLAAGSTITSENKRRIAQRGVGTVIIDEADAARVTIGHGVNELANAVPDAVLGERLDTVVRAGMMVSNTGPAVRHQLVAQGRRRYDEEFGSRVGARCRADSAHVDRLMYQVVQGTEVDGTQVVEMAENHLGDLRIDFSQSISVVFGTCSDSRLGEHSLKAALLAMAIAVEMGLDARHVRMVGTIAIVQDWGMAYVPRHIREARRPLTRIELLEVQKHPIRTVRMLERVANLPSVVQLVAYQSHERLDGSGYPRGREGKTIHPFARILHVADVYTAITSSRPFRPPFMAYGAMECVLDQAGRGRLDPEVVRALLHVLSLFPLGSLVALSDGSLAQVLRSNGADYTRPVVLRIQDSNGRPVDPQDDSALIDLTQSELTAAQAVRTPGRGEVPFRRESGALTTGSPDDSAGFDI